MQAPRTWNGWVFRGSRGPGGGGIRGSVLDHALPFGIHRNTLRQARQTYAEQVGRLTAAGGAIPAGINVTDPGNRMWGRFGVVGPGLGARREAWMNYYYGPDDGRGNRSGGLFDAMEAEIARQGRINAGDPPGPPTQWPSRPTWLNIGGGAVRNHMNLWQGIWNGGKGFIHIATPQELEPLMQGQKLVPFWGPEHMSVINTHLTTATSAFRGGEAGNNDLLQAINALQTR